MSENYSYDIFLIYYENAKKAQARGDIVHAKANLLRAASVLAEIAKNDTGELKKARVDRVERLIAIAENLENEQSIEASQSRNFSNKKNNAQSGEQNKNAGEEDGKIWKASQVPDVKFDDVVGLEGVKRTIRTRMINPVKYPEKYATYNKKTGGGVLLYGPPGTGKTMIAKAIANEVGATFYAVKGSDIVSKWVGESEKNINSLFETARNDKLAIIFIDEMDSLFGQRGQDMHNDKRVNEFLQQIDGFVGKAPNLLLLGATNRPWDVDGAAVRSGRFSEKIYIPLPDEKAREYMLKKSLSKVPLSDDIEWETLVQLTQNYSGADIDEVCDRAKEEPLNRYIQTDVIAKISMSDLLNAIKCVRPIVNEKEIRRFENYAGIDAKSQNAKDNEEPVDVDESSESAKFVDNDGLEIEFASETISIKPDEKPQIEFFLSQSCERVFLQIDGKHYNCEKHVKNWTAQVDICQAGEYDCVISFGTTQINKKLTFTKGIVENDIGI